MRWDELFADLEAQFEALAKAELASEVADRTRRERAQVRLADRVHASRGRPVVVRVGSGESLRGTLTRAGSDWLLVDEVTSEVVVPAGSLQWMTGLASFAEHPAMRGGIADRLDLGYILRGISRERTAVTLALMGGAQLYGTVDRVGADHLDLAEHDVGEPRRSTGVRAIHVVPFAAIAYVRRRPD